MATVRMLVLERLAERHGTKLLEPRIELKRVERMSSFTSRTKTKRTRDHSDSSWSESSVDVSPSVSPQFMRKRQTPLSLRSTRAKTLSKTDPKSSSAPRSLRSSNSIEYLSETTTASSSTAAKRGLSYGTKQARNYSSSSSSESSSSDYSSLRLTRKRIVAPSSTSKKYAKTSAKASKTSAKASKTKSKYNSTTRSLRNSGSLTWPCVTTMAECQKRDEVLRHYIIGHDWYQSQEFHLLRTMIMAPDLISGWKQYLDEYSLLYDVEWESNGSGKGDLLCTDGQNRFLVVELKTLKNSGTGSGTTHQTGRKIKKRTGENQTIKFAKAWHKGNPQVEETIGIFVTDEDGACKMIELPEDLTNSSTDAFTDSSSSLSSSDSEDTDFTL